MDKWRRFTSFTKVFIVLHMLFFCQQNSLCLEFRLVDGVHRNEGLLEVCQSKGWSTLCAEKWTKKNSRVVCRLLDFSDFVFSAPVNASSIHPEGSYTKVIANCNGKETKFKKCAGLTVDEDKCKSKQGLKLRCRTNFKILHENKGKIKVETIKGWKSLCGHNWGMNNAHTLCHQLGFPGVQETTIAPRSKDCACNRAFNCTRKEQSMDQCPRLTINLTCSVAFVTCVQDYRILPNRWRHTGPVQIYHQEEWGLLCDKTWNDGAANIMCKNLGYSMAVPINSSPVRPINVSGLRTWELAVSCSGTESVLQLCKGWKKVLGKCNSTTQVYIECQRQVYIGNNGGKERKGTVYIEQNDKKYTLCVNKSRNTDWSTQAAHIVCRARGYPGALRSDVDTVTANKCDCQSLVRCHGNVQRLEYCEYSAFQDAPCVQAKVVCNRRVRLFPSSLEDSSSDVESGQLQIYQNHEWGIIEDEMWTKNDANVTCRQLGFLLALSNYTKKKIPDRAGRIWMKNVDCNGNEQSLLDCRYEPDNKTIVSTEQGVGIHCGASGKRLCKVCKCENKCVKCRNKKLNSMPWVPEDFDRKNVESLDVKNNNISKVSALELNFPFLIYLDFSNNHLSKLPSDVFKNIEGLKVLKISCNQIETLPRGLFSNLTKLSELDLSCNKIKRIPDDMFSNNMQLEKLFLQGNSIRQLSHDWSKSLGYLKHLDISDNAHIESEWTFLNSLRNLEYLKSNKYIPFCCYALELRPELDCVAPSNAFSSCKDLLKGNELRIIIWLIISLAVVGNVCSILIGATLKERNRVQRLLITNLGISDLLNGIYLLIIAVVDQRWRGNYFKHDHDWRSSFTCNLTGFISMLSSQVSVFCLTAISTIRFLSVSFPFRFRGISMKKAYGIVAVIWILGILIAVAPFMDNSYFEEDAIGFYERNSVCLPLQLPGKKHNGWEYGLVMFGCLNFVLCVYLTFVYTSMFYSIGKSSGGFSSERSEEESALLKRLFFVVLTDLCCWIPVGILVYLSLAGYVNDPDNVIYAWFAVCVMSINSAFNPLLYTFTTPKVVTAIKQTAVYIWTLCRRRSDHDRDKRDIGVDLKDSSLAFENTVASEVDSSAV